jgi:hypothetical protein
MEGLAAASWGVFAILLSGRLLSPKVVFIDSVAMRIALFYWRCLDRDD